MGALHLWFLNQGTNEDVLQSETVEFPSSDFQVGIPSVDSQINGELLSSDTTDVHTDTVTDEAELSTADSQTDLELLSTNANDRKTDTVGLSSSVSRTDEATVNSQTSEATVSSQTDEKELHGNDYHTIYADTDELSSKEAHDGEHEPAIASSQTDAGDEVCSNDHSDIQNDVRDELPISEDEGDPAITSTSSTTDKLPGTDVQTDIVDELSSTDVSDVQIDTVHELPCTNVNYVQTNTVDELPSTNVNYVQTNTVDELSSTNVNDVQTNTVDELPSTNVNYVQTNTVDELSSTNVNDVQTNTVDELPSTNVNYVQTNTVDKLPSTNVNDVQMDTVDALPCIDSTGVEPHTVDLPNSNEVPSGEAPSPLVSPQLALSLSRDEESVSEASDNEDDPSLTHTIVNESWNTHEPSGLTCPTVSSMDQYSDTSSLPSTTMGICGESLDIEELPSTMSSTIEEDLTTDSISEGFNTAEPTSLPSTILSNIDEYSDSPDINEPPTLPSTTVGSIDERLNIEEPPTLSSAVFGSSGEISNIEEPPSLATTLSSTSECWNVTPTMHSTASSECFNTEDSLTSTTLDKPHKCVKLDTLPATSIVGSLPSNEGQDSAVSSQLSPIISQYSSSIVTVPGGGKMQSPHTQLQSVPVSPDNTPHTWFEPVKPPTPHTQSHPLTVSRPPPPLVPIFAVDSLSPFSTIKSTITSPLPQTTSFVPLTVTMVKETPSDSEGLLKTNPLSQTIVRETSSISKDPSNHFEATSFSPPSSYAPLTVSTIKEASSSKSPPNLLETMNSLFTFSSAAVNSKKQQTVVSTDSDIMSSDPVGPSPPSVADMVTTAACSSFASNVGQSVKQDPFSIQNLERLPELNEDLSSSSHIQESGTSMTTPVPPVSIQPPLVRASPIHTAAPASASDINSVKFEKLVPAPTVVGFLPPLTVKPLTPVIVPNVPINPPSSVVSSKAASLNRIKELVELTLKQATMPQLPPLDREQQKIVVDQLQAQIQMKRNIINSRNIPEPSPNLKTTRKRTSSLESPPVKKTKTDNSQSVSQPVVAEVVSSGGKESGKGQSANMRSTDVSTGTPLSLDPAQSGSSAEEVISNSIVADVASSQKESVATFELPKPSPLATAQSRASDTHIEKVVASNVQTSSMSTPLSPPLDNPSSFKKIDVNLPSGHDNIRVSLLKQPPTTTPAQVTSLTLHGDGARADYSSLKNSTIALINEARSKIKAEAVVKHCGGDKFSPIVIDDGDEVSSSSFVPCLSPIEEEPLASTGQDSSHSTAETISTHSTHLQHLSKPTVSVPPVLSRGVPMPKLALLSSGSLSNSAPLSLGSSQVSQHDSTTPPSSGVCIPSLLRPALPVTVSGTVSPPLKHYPAHIPSLLTSLGVTGAVSSSVAASSSMIVSPTSEVPAPRPATPVSLTPSNPASAGHYSSLKPAAAVCSVNASVICDSPGLKSVSTHCLTTTPCLVSTTPNVISSAVTRPVIVPSTQTVPTTTVGTRPLNGSNTRSVTETSGSPTPPIGDLSGIVKPPPGKGGLVTVKVCNSLPSTLTSEALKVSSSGNYRPTIIRPRPAAAIGGVLIQSLEPTSPDQSPIPRAGGVFVSVLGRCIPSIEAKDISVGE